MMQILVHFDMPGTHNYPGHAMLNMKHLHKFFFTVAVPETSERDIEFIEFQQMLRQNFMNLFSKIRFENNYKNADYWNAPMGCEFGARSCEDLAKILGNEVMKILPDLTGLVEIVVSEHDRNAGVIYKEEAENLVSNYRDLPEGRRIG